MVTDSASTKLLGDIEYVEEQFKRTFHDGIPLLLNDRGAFLSFICMVSGLDALAGYRFPDIGGNGIRFRRFVNEYFPKQYHDVLDDLWSFRNSMVHAFSPGPFALCHHQSHLHWAGMQHAGGVMKTINAEDFYATFVQASSAYFGDVRSSQELQAAFRRRLANASGGGPMVVVANVSAEASERCPEETTDVREDKDNG